MKKKKGILVIFVIMILILNINCSYAAPVATGQVNTDDNTIHITLSDEKILVNDEPISTVETENLYLSNSMSNGGSSVNATTANIAITNIINIKESGTYEFTGSLSDGQIAIDSNKIVGNVNIVLNNVNISCQKAPAIFIYNAKNDPASYEVNIQLADGSTNTISGGKIKQSVEGWEDQSNLLYYVEKGYDDDGTYYERYKYDAAISSDVSLKFNGTGLLTVNAFEKEGIESKRHITINSGNYIINSLDDAINACTNGESVITINGGTVLANVSSNAEEGDGIDSNGSIYINGGKVFAFASEKSQDSGLDSDTGIYINGGYVVGTGNMADEVSDYSEQGFLQMRFTNQITKDALVTILDESKNPIIAFKTDRAYSILTVSSPKIQDGEHYAYEGGTIEGTNENGLYTDITSYTEGTIKEYSDVANMMKSGDFRPIEASTEKNNESDLHFYIMLSLCTVLIILLILTILLVKSKKINIKGNLVILIIGMILGAIITLEVGYQFYIKKDNNNVNEQNQFERGERPEMPSQGQNGENPPTKPNEQENGNGKISPTKPQ